MLQDLCKINPDLSIKSAISILVIVCPQTIYVNFLNGFDGLNYIKYGFSLIPWTLKSLINLSIFESLVAFSSVIPRWCSGGGAARGAPPSERFWGKRRLPPPPWIFRIWRERVLLLTTEIEKVTKRKKEKEEYRFWSYDGQENHPSPLFPPIYFLKNNILIRKYVSMTTLKSD